MNEPNRILVVDDDSDIRMTLGLVLERNGYAVKTAESGAAALSTLEQYQPDLIILDVMMTTDTEGFEVAKRIRADQKTRDLPIILVTSFLEKVRTDGPKQFVEILNEEFPAQWLFEKPVDFKKLLAKIRGLLHERETPASDGGAR